MNPKSQVNIATLFRPSPLIHSKSYGYLNLHQLVLHLHGDKIGIEYDLITQININHFINYMAPTGLCTHDPTTMQEGLESQSENRFQG